jgi:hypothetical protein
MFRMFSHYIPYLVKNCPNEGPFSSFQKEKGLRGVGNDRQVSSGSVRGADQFCFGVEASSLAGK